MKDECPICELPKDSYNCRLIHGKETDSGDVIEDSQEASAINKSRPSTHKRIKTITKVMNTIRKDKTLLNDLKIIKKERRKR